MAGVVVIGGGFGGLAAALRLAKLGHQVTLVEAEPTLGGALRPVERDGYRWDGDGVVLPPPGRRSRPLPQVRAPDRARARPGAGAAAPGASIRRWLPVSVLGGSRAEQMRAFDRLGPGLGDQWCDFVGAFADDWELIRRNYLERPWSPLVAPPELAGATAVARDPAPATETLVGRPQAPVGRGLSPRVRRPRRASGAGVAGHHVVRRAGVRRLDDRRWPVGLDATAGRAAHHEAGERCSTPLSTTS